MRGHPLDQSRSRDLRHVPVSSLQSRDGDLNARFHFSLDHSIGATVNTSCLRMIIYLIFVAI